MKKITTLIITLLCVTNLIAQKDSYKATFSEFANHNIAFENPKLEEYTDKLAQIQYKICKQRFLEVEPLDSKLEVLTKKYSSHLKNISKNDQENLNKINDIINKDYVNCVEQLSNKLLKTALLKQEKKLKKLIKKVKPSFENKEFEKFANKMQVLLSDQCSNKISVEDYNAKFQKLKKEYTTAIKTVSKKDNEMLMLLSQNISITCQCNDIRKQIENLLQPVANKV